MRALFDVNVLIALFQPDHVHHEIAHIWLRKNGEHGWATCPITENGFVRILSNPRFPLPQSPATALQLLILATQGADHQFWPNSSSLTDNSVFDIAHLSNHGQITDVSLLASAVLNGGRLVTFDRKIRSAAVKGCKPENLVIL
jgi:uncharacterized protein